MVGDDHDRQRRVVERAIEIGADYFDTAADYGDGASETNLGRALHEIGRPVRVSTKVVLNESDLVHVRDAVLRNFELSLRRLRRDRVDALMLHNRVAHSRDFGRFGGKPMLDLDDVFGPHGLVAAFEEILEAGQTSAVGFTALGGETSAVAELVDSGAFGCINASFNMVNPSAAIAVPRGFTPNYHAVITRAAAAGMGVMAIQPFAAGVLFQTNGLDPRETRLVELAHSTGESVASVAVRYVMSKSSVTAVILGVTEERHIIEAVEAASRGPLDAETVAEIERF
jgi:aryl-alcohol dehydrogenase-like predicted oxidoreductase